MVQGRWTVELLPLRLGAFVFASSRGETEVVAKEPIGMPKVRRTGSEIRLLMRQAHDRL